MGFHFPRGGSGASTNLQETLEALVAEITLMRKAMEEMGCFVGIDCPDDPVDPEPTFPECSLYSNGSVLVDSQGNYIVLSSCDTPVIPANTLYVNGEPLVDSQGNYVVGG